MWFSSLGVILNRIKSLMLNKLIEIITEDEYGKNTQMPNGKMDNRLTTLEETLDSVSESVIDKLIPAVIKMQKDVKVYIIN